MKKTIIIGAILAGLILIMIPSISAIEKNTIENTNPQNLIESLIERIIEFTLLPFALLIFMITIVECISGNTYMETQTLIPQQPASTIEE